MDLIDLDQKTNSQYQAISTVSSPIKDCLNIIQRCTEFIQKKSNELESSTDSIITKKHKEIESIEKEIERFIEEKKKKIEEVNKEIEKEINESTEKNKILFEKKHKVQEIKPMLEKILNNGENCQIAVKELTSIMDVLKLDYEKEFKKSIEKLMKEDVSVEDNFFKEQKKAGFNLGNQLKKAIIGPDNANSNKEIKKLDHFFGFPVNMPNTGFGAPFPNTTNYLNNDRAGLFGSPLPFNTNFKKNE